MKNENKQIAAIDFFKMFAASMIVFWHCGLCQKIGEWSIFLGTLSLPTWAVPFFFCAGGFFLYKHLAKYNNIKSTIKRLIVLYIVWTIIYIPYNLIVPILKGTFSFSLYIKNFFILGSYGHLWFLPALIYAYIFVALVKNKWLLLIISIVGVIYGLFGSSYYHLITQIPLFENISSNYKQFDEFRRFISLAIPYVTLGYLISNNEIHLKNISISKLDSCLVIIVICYISEIYVIGYFNWARDIFNSIFQIPLVFLIFIICINTHFKNDIVINRYATWCRKASIFIYFVHFFVIQTLYYLVGNMLLSKPLYLFLLTYLISTLLAYFVIKVNNPLLNKLIM